MGRIGTAVEKRLSNYRNDFNSITIEKDTNSKIEKKFNAKYWNDLDQMISQMDIISIHCPFTA